ncbi:MAG: AMP-binding protein [Bacillota bacterium]|nr:AMP-binding protein [Bacillota bacterium]
MLINNSELTNHEPVIISSSDEGLIFEPLLDKIRKVAGGTNTITFVGSAAGNSDKESVTIGWGELHRNALAMAAILQNKGIQAGDHIALLGPTTRNLVTAIQAVWLAGGSVSMLPIPMRFSSVEEFANQTRALMLHGDISLLLLDPDLAAFHEVKPGDPPVLLLDELLPGEGRPNAEDYREVPCDPERLAVLQFTSGSTSNPKGVMLPYRVLEANTTGMIASAEVVPDDIFVSWLPLYHDMGLIGLLTVPMTVGCSLVLASPQDFLSRPADWMRWMHNFKGTVTSGPNFSWVLAARAFKRMTDTGEMLDLSGIRLALNGAEPVDPDVVETLIETSAPHGFRAEAVFCAFGMAELSLGGTFPPPLRGMATDAVDRKALEEEKIARPADPKDEKTRRFPLLGSPIPGLEMRICSLETGELRGLREVGELQIRGTSVMTGYYNQPDLNETLFTDGWLRTGDLAYFVEGPGGAEPELVICGRIKDVIIISGRNIFPEDIERAVGSVEGVRAGNVIAFGVEGSKRKETIVVVAEIRADDHAAVRRAIREQVVGVVGFPPRDIMLVQPGTLPKTSSGKLQRNLCRQQYLNKELKTVE